MYPLFFQGGSYQVKTNGGYTTTLAEDADTSLIVGSEETESNLDVTIENCYEGLEGGTVYVEGGRPGGGPGGRSVSAYAMGSSEYAIYINGGTLYVNAAGDGLDSNGNLSISGGNIIVYGAAAEGHGSDNFPFDHDGTFTITGGNIFGAGSSQMEERVDSSTQGYVVDKNTYNQGTVISVTDSQGNVLFTEELVKRVNYMMYSSPVMTTSGSYIFKSGTSADQTDIRKCQVTLDKDSYTYDGMAKMPAFTVAYNGKYESGRWNLSEAIKGYGYRSSSCEHIQNKE